MKLLVLALLALPLSMQAQQAGKHLDELFEKIINTRGIEASTSRNVVRYDEDGNRTNDLIESTTIHDIRVRRPNFGLFKELEDAFLSGNTEPTTIYTCFNPLDGSRRQQWNIVTKRGIDIRIGQHTNSSYAIVVYPDANSPRNRTVYAAEWWDTDDNNIKQGVLVRSYGEKPRMGSQLVQNFQGMSHLPYNILDIDSVFRSHNVPELNGLLSNDWQRFGIQQLDSVVINLPFDGTNLPDWYNMAIRNVGRLSNADWHRLFGLLTQRILDRTNRIGRETNEELVVTAGVLLDLCNHADQLDADEKKVSAKRLDDVAIALLRSGVERSQRQYVHDLLELAAKKLRK